MKLTKNFDLSEFASKDGSEFPEDVIIKLKRVAENLQVLRDYLNRPIKVNSGYRSLEHNKNVKGKKNSYHPKGMASDIQVDGLTPQQVFDTIVTLQNIGKMTIGGLHAYSTFVHYDIRGYVARW